MNIQLAFEKLVGDDHVGRGNSFPEVAQVLVELPHFFGLPGLPKARLFLSLVHPVQGKPVEEGGVSVVAANANEFSFPVLVRLLKDRKDRPPGDPVEANP